MGKKTTDRYLPAGSWREVFWPPRRVLINPGCWGSRVSIWSITAKKKSSSFRLSRLTDFGVYHFVDQEKPWHPLILSRVSQSWHFRCTTSVSWLQLLIRSMNVKEVNGLICFSCAFGEAKVLTDRNRWWHRSEPDALEMASSNWLKPSRMNAWRSC